MLINAEKVMTFQEARKCIDEINDNLRNTRALLLDLYERKGWEALGYDSWRACVAGEFKQHQSYLYRQLEAAQAEINISPMGEKPEIGKIPERQLRPLTKLAPQEQREVWDEVTKETEGKPTAKDVEKKVSEILHKDTFPVSDAMSYARMAIHQLERILADDPKRDEAFELVEEWIYQNK